MANGQLCTQKCTPAAEAHGSGHHGYLLYFRLKLQQLSTGKWFSRIWDQYPVSGIHII